MLRSILASSLLFGLALGQLETSLTVDQNLTSTCPPGYSDVYSYGNYTANNGSLKDIWAYFGNWGNKTWGDWDVPYVSDNGTEPGSLRNYSMVGGKPGTEQLIWRLGTDANNVPWAPAVSIGFRVTYSAMGSTAIANQVQIWWATQPAATATDPMLDKQGGVVFGFNLYECSTNTSTGTFLSKSMGYENYFNGDGITYVPGRSHYASQVQSVPPQTLYPYDNTANPTAPQTQSASATPSASTAKPSGSRRRAL